MTSDLTTDLAQWARSHSLARWFGSRDPEPEQVEGLILSGGGSCSSFQVGALRYLYDVEKIEPQVIVGTSAGSIIGSVLAQFEDHDHQRAALLAVERLWRGMQESSDMFAPFPWFDRLKANAPAWLKVMQLQRRSEERAGLLQSLMVSLGRAKETDKEKDLALWSPSSALETISTLWEAGRRSADLQLIMAGATTERAAFSPGPIVQEIQDPDIFDPDRLRSSAVKLRVSVVGLESGGLYYVDGSGKMVDRSNNPVAGGEPWEVVRAIQASCSIPGVFSPVAHGREHFVDGGVRENVPFQMAEHLGVTRSYTVVATMSGVSPRPSFEQADMMDIVMRSVVGIMADEVQHDEVQRALRSGSTVIQPDFEVHDSVTIDPGLISIAVDYGYMRAADVCRDVSEEKRQLTYEVVSLRKSIWKMENELFSPEVLSDDIFSQPVVRPASKLARKPTRELIDLKLKLRSLTDQLDEGSAPAGARDWWKGYEAHPYDIIAPARWSK